MRCPVDDTPVDARRDVVEAAVDAAVTQSARVILLRHSDYDSPDGSIAALLRF